MQPITGSRALLSGLIDYAGVFPPASLSPAAAVAEYREVRSGPHDWLVHRFLCRASQLEELAALLAASMRAGDRPWPIGLIVDGPLGRSIAAGQAFEAEMSPGATITAVEARLGVDDPAGDVWRIADVTATFRDAIAYCELDLAGDLDAALDEIASVAHSGRRVGAKIRCGGVDAAAVPTVDALARGLVAAARHRVAVKATAGLHHPVRGHDATLGNSTHGFLNVVVASHLAVSGHGEADVAGALADEDADGFVVTSRGVRWRDHEIPARTLMEHRGVGFHGFGSCSISEPVEDLTAMGVLGAGP